MGHSVKIPTKRVDQKVSEPNSVVEYELSPLCSACSVAIFVNDKLTSAKFALKRSECHCFASNKQQDSRMHLLP